MPLVFLQEVAKEAIGEAEKSITALRHQVRAGHLAPGSHSACQSGP